MRLTPVGKAVFFILVVGLAVGGFRLWQRLNPGVPGTPATSGTPGVAASPRASEVPSSGGPVEIEFIITAAKGDWAQDQIERFNKVHGAKWTIKARPVPSRDAMHDILGGKARPVLWSPGSPIWPTRLAEAWQQKNGKAILDMSDPQQYRVFLRSPLVIMTTRKKAEFLRPLLGGARTWDSLRQLSTGQKKVPWGRFRFSHADPLTSSSGILTLGLMMVEYAQEHQQTGDYQKVATDPAFMGWIKQIEQSLEYDEPAEKGTTALYKAFVKNPARYDLITAYESHALQAAAKHSDLAVIYPNPTAVSEHSVSLLTAEWVTPQQRAGAMEFMKFLGSTEALQAGLKYHFRPVQASSALSLAPELSRLASMGFSQSYVNTELPPYEALNAAAYKWRIDVAGKPVTEPAP